MRKYVKTLTVLALAVTTLAASPASAFDRIFSNGLAVKGTERNGVTTTLDSQSLRVIGIELPASLSLRLVSVAKCRLARKNGCFRTYSFVVFVDLHVCYVTHNRDERSEIRIVVRCCALAPE